MRTRIVQHLPLASVLVVLISASAIGAPDPIEKAREAGEIWGKVSFCGPEGPVGIVAYIPKVSKVAYLDGSGDFELNLVAPGTYTVKFARNGKTIGQLENVIVARRTLTDLRDPPIALCPDVDGDGFTPADGDCDDFNARAYPGAPELCGDGIDNNCIDGADESCPSCQDVDTDGFYAQIGCGFVDCDDSDPSIYPGAQESCDGTDNDCDGAIDEPDSVDAVPYYPDLDGDSTGDDLGAVLACVAPDGYISVGGDCNDLDPAVGPFAIELCGDGIDNDCDGLTDLEDECSEAICSDLERVIYEECTANCGTDPNCVLGCATADGIGAGCSEAIGELAVCTVNECFDIIFDGTETQALVCAYERCFDFYSAVFGDVYPGECFAGEVQTCGSDVGQCTPGIQGCDNGIWGACEGGFVGPSAELCDGIDNDCDGEADEQCADCTDADEDLYATGPDPFVCESLGYLGFDCDDNDPETNPDASEVCDGIDNNCDGQVDEGTDEPVNNGVNQCVNGSFVLQCNDGFFDLNGLIGDGCEHESICGDGIVDDFAGEQCDDGNDQPGDGCDFCEIEP